MLKQMAGTALFLVAVPAGATPLRVAAAADLANAFKELGAAYSHERGEVVVFSFGSTGLLEKQIAEGAPFDVFAAANVSYIDDAVRAGSCLGDTKAAYARGRIVVWWPKTSTLPPPRSLADLADARFGRIAIANPAHAPYGKAAEQALRQAHVWERVQTRLVFGENVQQTLQFAQSGNVDLALVALSLATTTGDGEWLPVPAEAHAPIEQALVVCGDDPAQVARARAFTAYVGSPRGRAIMRRYGFLLPGETQTASAK